jgi:hypothetical protein
MTDDSWLTAVRIAREVGDVSSLFPEGITRLADLPFTIFNLITNSLYYVSFDELPKAERPKKSIWLNSERMDEHWQAVEAMRQEKTKGRGDTSQMPKNALIDELIVGR